MRLEKTSGLHRILVYAPPKSGKTRFITSLPYDIFGDAIYVAADRNSEQLDGVLAEDTKHLRIEKPVLSDVFRESCKIATTDWSKESGIGTVIWDTMTTTAQDLLRYFTSQDRYSHVSIGQKGTAAYVTSSDMGDYALTHNAVNNLTAFLFEQKTNLIITCQADWDMPDKGEGGGLVGGPQTVGKAQIREYGKAFTAVLHMSAGRGKDGKPEFLVHTAAHGIWQAGVRTGTPVDDAVLSAHPVEFWSKLNTAIRGER